MTSRLASLINLLSGGVTDAHAAAIARRSELSRTLEQLCDALGAPDATAALAAVRASAARVSTLTARLADHDTRQAQLEAFAGEACALTRASSCAATLGVMRAWQSWMVRGVELEATVERLRAQLQEVELQNRVLRQYLRTPALFRCGAKDEG